MAGLRDWLRGLGTAAGARVYVGGLPKAAVLPACSLRRVGGGAAGTYDHPLVQVDAYAASGSVAEAIAMAMATALEAVTPGTWLSDDVQLMGATVVSVIWLTDPSDDTPRYVLTAECWTRALSLP